MAPPKDSHPTADAASLIGGRYAPRNLLGSGGFGQVYAAQDTQADRIVAVKFLSAGNAEALTRFEREALILDRLANHPNIVSLLDSNLAHAPPYIVTEYCQLGSLRNWVGERRPWKMVVGAMMHAVVGLDALHVRGGFHRDIKPDNMLVANHPTEANGLVIKLADFGLARLPETQTHLTRSQAGTPGYVAPEVVDGSPYTAPADIYSLGCVAAELLSGDVRGAALRSVDVPGELRSLVETMLATDPNARPDIKGVAQSLTRVWEGPAAEAAPPPRSSSSGFGVGELIVAALLVGGVAAVIAALAHGKKQPAQEAADDDD